AWRLSAPAAGGAVSPCFASTRKNATPLAYASPFIGWIVTTCPVVSAAAGYGPLTRSALAMSAPAYMPSVQPDGNALVTRTAQPSRATGPPNEPSGMTSLPAVPSAEVGGFSSKYAASAAWSATTRTRVTPGPVSTRSTI